MTENAKRVFAVHAKKIKADYLKDKDNPDINNGIYVQMETCLSLGEMDAAYSELVKANLLAPSHSGISTAGDFTRPTYRPEELGLQIAIKANNEEELFKLLDALG